MATVVTDMAAHQSCSRYRKGSNESLRSLRPTTTKIGGNWLSRPIPVDYADFGKNLAMFKSDVTATKTGSQYLLRDADCLVCNARRNCKRECRNSGQTQNG